MVVSNVDYLVYRYKNYVSDCDTKVIKRIFLVRSEEKNETVPLLVKESEMYKDILQGDFTDAFSSAAYKVFSGLKFVKEFC